MRSKVSVSPYLTFAYISGPEKLLEVWFCSSAAALPPGTLAGGLKSVPQETWKEMLDLVNCQVLSTIESDQVDAYLLSESSMFISPHKLILKTCGTTTLLCGLPRILEIAALVARFPQTRSAATMTAAATPYRVFYSRKNFLFPDRQKGPHRSWRDEVKSLDRLFLGGSAYMIGKMNGEHWYLYLTEPNTTLTPPLTPEKVESEGKLLHSPLSQLSQDDAVDETLEILMTDLDEANTKQFHVDHVDTIAEASSWNRSSSQEIIGESLASDSIDIFSECDEKPFPPDLTSEGHALGSVVSDTCGLSDVYPVSQYPDARIDAYLFSPCGFSANGVIPSPRGSTGTHYFTVHVTPEPHCSFASFESNVPTKRAGRDPAEVVEQVVRIFQPGRFSVTLFETTLSNSEVVNSKSSAPTMDSILGYRRIDRIVHDLEGYNLVFLYYERWDWQGGAPRLGEAYG